MQVKINAPSVKVAAGVQRAGSDNIASTTEILKGNGTGGAVAAIPNVDYIKNLPEWIGDTKPTYTAAEVGALPIDTPIPDFINNDTYTVDQYTNATGYAEGDIVGFDKIRDLQAKQRGAYFTKWRKKDNVISEFVGDSIFADNVNQTIAEYFSNFYDYSITQNKMAYYVNAYGGATAEYIYTELADPEGSENADIVFISAGTNDAVHYADGESGYTVQEYAENLTKLFCKYVLRGAYVIFCASPPCQAYFSALSANLAHEYSRVAKMIGGYFGIPTFDAQAEFTGYKYSDVTNDGLHYSDSGKQTFAIKLLAYATGRGSENVLHLTAGSSVRLDNLDAIGATYTSGVSLISSTDPTMYADAKINGVVTAGAVALTNSGATNEYQMLTIPIYTERDNLFIVPNCQAVATNTQMWLEMGGGCAEYIIDPKALALNATAPIETDKSVTLTGTQHEVGREANGLKTMSNALFIANKGYHVINIWLATPQTVTEINSINVVAYEDVGGDYTAEVNVSTNAEIWSAVTAGKTVTARETTIANNITTYTYYQRYFLSEIFAIFNAVIIDTSDGDKIKIKQYIVYNDTWTPREKTAATAT